MDHYNLIANLFEQEKTSLKDYEKYLNTAVLLSCQKQYHKTVNRDEIQFQIVHQVEELWMKLIAVSLKETLDHLAQSEHCRALTLLQRCHKILDLMTTQLQLLETMSVKDYQTIRLELGNGSGQESPGFQTLLKFEKPLWQAFQKYCLKQVTLEELYDEQYQHDLLFLLAEAFIDFDERLQRFRYCHIQLIQRSIGDQAKSLKGRPVELLERGYKKQFFPELWAIRSKMTDQWGQNYGVKRDPLDD